MKFKKFLGAVCSFLLATTSLFCGGPASAKTFMGKNFYVFMVNSGEDLGNGERDGDECDKACWGTIADATTKLDHTNQQFGYSSKYSGCDVYRYLMLNQECPTAVKAIKNITGSSVPDVFVVVVNLAKNSKEVQKDINKHFDQILDCQKDSVLYRSNTFESSNAICGKEVYLDTVPVVIYGVVPEGMEQKTSNDKFVKIAKQTKRERQGNGVKDGKFKYIHNEVYVRQPDGKHISINMENNNQTTDVDIYQVIKAIAEDESLQPTLWENYRDKELPRRCPELARRKEEAKRKAEEEAKRKNKKIVGGGLCAALAIGSAIFGIRKGNQNKNKNKNQRKPQVPKTQVQKSQVQKSQVAANA